MATHNAELNRLIADLVASQQGLVSTDQLLARGATVRQIGLLAQTHRWDRITNGLYQTDSQRRDVKWHLRAAQLATRGRSLIVGAGALLMHQLISDDDWLFRNRDLEIGVGTRTQPTLDSICHRLIKPVEFSTQKSINGLFVVSPERALVDACRLMRPERAERVIEDAIRRKLTNATALAHRLSIQTAGNPVLRMILSAYQHVLKSDLEVCFAQLLRRFGIEQPIFQYELRVQHGDRKSMRIDAYWECARLAVELDGFAYHSNARELQSDRIRQNALLGQGIQLRRYSFADIQERPGEVAREIRRLLKQSVA
jgi:very-short-patch-repair endonuclease